MTSPLDKLLHLIRRATHPETPKEEARTCAMLACRFIVEHKVSLQLKDAVQEDLETLFSEWFDDFWSDRSEERRVGKECRL